MLTAPAFAIRSCRVQPRSLDRPRRRRLLHRHVDLRVVSRRADSSLARSRPLATADAAAATREPAQHAGRSGLVRHLGAVPDPRRRPVLSDLHRREALRPHVAAGRRAARRCATSTTIWSRVRASTAIGPIPIYLNSSGFDPSLFHDDDGRKYLVNMLWDHRPGQNRFAGIVLQEYSAGRAAADRRTHD